MGNTSSERAGMGQGEKTHRRDSRGAKEGDRPKILMDSPEDADIFHGEDMKARHPPHTGFGLGLGQCFPAFFALRTPISLFVVP